MKKIILLSLAFLGVVKTSAAETVSVECLWNGKGIRTTTADDGTVTKEGFSSCNKTTKEVSGKTSSSVFKYDDNGNTISASFSEYSGGVKDYEQVYTFDSNNNITSMTDYRCKNETCSTDSFYTYEYEDAGGNNLQTSKRYDCRDSVCSFSNAFTSIYEGKTDAVPRTLWSGQKKANLLEDGYFDCNNGVCISSGIYKRVMINGIEFDLEYQCSDGTCTLDDGDCADYRYYCDIYCYWGSCSASIYDSNTGEEQDFDQFAWEDQLKKDNVPFVIDAYENINYSSTLPDNGYCLEGCTSCDRERLCSVCVEPYRLVNGQCTQLPENCAEGTSGACTLCDDGYLTSGGECMPAADCKNGLHEDNGACVNNPTGCNTYNDGLCSECNSGYLTNSAGLCTKIEDCKDGFFADSEAGACKPIPGCSSFSDGACSCDKGYYKKAGGCVSESDGCGDGYLGKEDECISASNGCGSGYKDMGGFCNRVRYTPAEAAAVANDDNTNVVTITFRK